VDMAGLIRRANLLAFSFKEATDSISAHRDRLVAMPSIMPTTGWLTSAFASMREHPISSARCLTRHRCAGPWVPPSSLRRGRSDSTGWETGYGTRSRSIRLGSHQVRPCSKILVHQASG
jgi:hypothetical protein